MRRKCHTCLCQTCLKVCGKCTDCKEKTEFCDGYNCFWQESIFGTHQEPQYHSVPRHSWKHYGISKERYMQLTEYIQSGRYTSVARQAAHRANETIAEYLIMSIAENKSYDALKVKWELKEMERIPYCRTDFYGIRRYFFSIFNEKMKEIGK